MATRRHSKDSGPLSLTLAAEAGRFCLRGQALVVEDTTASAVRTDFSGENKLPWKQP